MQDQLISCHENLREARDALAALRRHDPRNAPYYDVRWLASAQCWAILRWIPER